MQALQTLDQVRYRTQQFSLLMNAIMVQVATRVFQRSSHVEDPKALLNIVRQRYRNLLERDLDNVAHDLYPKQLLFDFPARQYLSTLPQLFLDAPRYLRRRENGNFKEMPEHLNLDEYPAYYRRNFHWQTDGYLSEYSANLYDISVEVLFLGMADVMRRQIIPPITRYLEEHTNKAHTHQAHQPANATRQAPRLLDVACGTGRIFEQLAITHPHLRLFGLDLSPFYLQHARQQRGHIADISFVAANAEEMPFCDEYFDIVTSIYLFHELPRRARRNVYQEMFRVLRPGGLLVIEDSAQLAESASIKPSLMQFADNFHEPYYKEYLDDAIEEALTEAGFIVEEVEPHFVAKVVTARKPA